MMILTDAELVEITKRKRHPAQARALRAMDIKYLIRPDGSLVVLKTYVEHLLGGKPQARLKAPPQPDWTRL